MNTPRGLVACYLSVAWTLAHGADPTTVSTRPAGLRAGESIRVITYNVQFLPGVARLLNKRAEPEYRARTLGQKLAAYDIVGLNEVFHDVHREFLLAELRNAWGDACQIVFGPMPTGLRYNGGLAIAGRLPFLESHTLTYSKWSTPDKYGFNADGFAAKGALHARVGRGEGAAARDFIDVFVTHLDSKDDEVRRFQYEELSAFIARHGAADRPALILGDFNTKATPPRRPNPGSDYDLLLWRLRQARPTVLDLWPVLRGDAVGGTTVPDRGRRIDYIFLCNPTGTACQLKPLDIRINGFPDPRVGPLSDHAAVEADFRWKILSP